MGELERGLEASFPSRERVDCYGIESNIDVSSCYRRVRLVDIIELVVYYRCKPITEHIDWRVCSNRSIARSVSSLGRPSWTSIARTIRLWLDREDCRIRSLNGFWLFCLNSASDPSASSLVLG